MSEAGTKQRWVVAGAMGLLGYVVWGIGFYAMPVFYVPLETEFHWSRTQVTFMGGLLFFVYSISGPAVGSLTDAAGVRKVLVFGMLLFGASLTFFTFWMNTLATYYALACTIGLASMCVSLLPAQVLISRWFERNRAAVMGIVLAVMALGGVVNSALAGNLITRLGWRETMFVFDLMVWVIALPISIFLIRDRPQRSSTHSEELRPVGSNPNESLSLRAALGSPEFYLLCSGVLLNRIAGNGLLQNIVLHVNGLGHGLEFGSYVMSGFAMANLFSRLIIGAASDRISLRFGIVFSHACIALSVLLFLTATGRPMLFLGGLVAGMGYGGGILAMPVLTGAIFGTRALGKILGLVLLASGVGSMAGIFLVGRMYDATKSYQQPFVLLLVFAVASVVAVWPIRPRSAVPSTT
jgi:MFS family permease